MTKFQPLIDAILTGYKTGIRQPVAAPLPQNRDDAIAIQLAVSPHIGPIAAYKVGMLGPHAPVIAPIRASHIFKTGTSVPFHDKMGIELEIAFVVTTNDTSGPFPLSPQNAFAPCVAIELVDTRLIGDHAGDDLVKYCDNQITFGIVTNSPIENWDGSDFTVQTAALHVDDAVLHSGNKSVPGGSALASLRAVWERRAEISQPLQQGDIIITGSLTGCDYVNTPCTLTGTLDALGTISVTLTQNSSF